MSRATWAGERRVRRGWRRRFIANINSREQTFRGRRTTCPHGSLILWLNKQYGCNIVADDPATLAAAVADGGLLCKLARDLSGNAKLKFTTHKPNVFKVNDNLAAFATECKRMGLPDVCTRI
jgi:hypothetical protein